MKKLFITFLILISAMHSNAQKKIAGVYDIRYKEFTPEDTCILVKEFIGGLALFMIKGANPVDLKNDRVGFMDTTGRVVIKPVFNNAGNFNNGHALVEYWRLDSIGREYHVLSLINKKGKTIIPPKYYGINECINGLYVCVADRTLTFISATGHILVKPGKYNAYAIPIQHFHGEGDDTPYSGFRWNPLWNFPSIQFRRFIGVRTTNGKWTVIDSTGRELFAPKFDRVGIFEGSVAPVMIEKKYTIADITGHILFQPEYDLLELTKINSAIVKLNNKYGVVSLSGKVIIPPKYEYLEQISTNTFKVGNQYNYGVIDTNGKLIIPVERSQIEPFGDGYSVSANNSNELYNKEGRPIAMMKEVVDNKFPFWISSRNDSGYVYDKFNGRYNKYEKILTQTDSQGNVAIAFFYKNNKWGVIDADGRETDGLLFDDVKIVFHNGFYDGQTGAITRQGKKHGFISDSKTMIPAKYDSVYVDYTTNNVINGSKPFFSVEINNTWALVTASGKVLTAFKYRRPLKFQYNIAIASEETRRGIVNTNGKEVLPCIYDDIDIRSPDVIIIKRNGKYGVITSTGKVIEPCIYNMITSLDGKTIEKR